MTPAGGSRRAVLGNREDATECNEVNSLRRKHPSNQLIFEPPLTLSKKALVTFDILALVMHKLLLDSTIDV